MEQPAVQVQQNKLAFRRIQEYGIVPSAEIDDFLATYRLHDVSAAECLELGFTNPSDGIYIQYTKDADSRIRYNRSGFQAQQDLGKYGQRPNTLPALYVPPTIAPVHLKDANLPVLLIEGEFKAIVADYIMNRNQATPEILPLAMSGVWSWQSKKKDVALIDGLDEILTLGRRVFIAFDMDNPVNEQVQYALQCLCNKLAERNIVPEVLAWPSAEGKGLDDYLVGRPVPRSAFQTLLSNAQKPSHMLQVLRMNGQFVYDRVQDMVYDFNTSSYVKPVSFKSHYFTEQIKQTITVGTKQVNKVWTLGDYWMQSPARATCDGKTFAPGAERLVQASLFSASKQLNTWQAWGQGSDLRKLVPAQGDVEPFLRWLKETFGRNQLIPDAPAVDCVDYLIKRLAWIFQQPTVKHPTWVYLIGRPMQGKSTLINIITRLIGDRYTSHIDESALGSSFSEWRSEKLLIAFDDVAVVERSRIKQVLKRMTTEQTTRVNKKYEKEYTAKTYETFFFAANGMDPLLDHDDRRALVLEARCEWTKDEWQEFDRWVGTPSNYNALLHYFMYEVKIDDAFLKLRPPLTRMRELVTESAESGWDEFIYNLGSPNPFVYQAPADGTVRKFKPSLVTPEMLKTLYALVHGQQDPKHEIKGATLTAKLQRLGAVRVVPYGTTDARGRVVLYGKQTQLWTWDYKWTDCSNQEMLAELKDIRKHFPELFAAYQPERTKF